MSIFETTNTLETIVSMLALQQFSQAQALAETALEAAREQENEYWAGLEAQEEARLAWQAEVAQLVDAIPF